MYFLLRIAVFTWAFLIVGSSLAAAQSVTLAWDANAEPEVTGYRLSYGTQSGVYPNRVDAGNSTSYTVTGLDMARNYYFAVQAYTASGVTSALSQEVMLPALVPPGTTTISAFGADAAYPLLTGRTVTYTASATSTRGPVEYKFMAYNARDGWRIAQNFSPLSSYAWTPTFGDVGTNVVQVWARTVGSPAAYEAWVGTNPFEVTAAPVRLTADIDFPAPRNQPIKWTAAVAGASGDLEYKFLVLNVGTGIWSELRSYGPSNEVVWTPQSNGTFNLQVWARRVGSTASYEAWAGTPQLRIASTTLAVASLAVDRTMPTVTGSPITWTARTRGGLLGPLEFLFYRYSVTANRWEVVQNYSTSNTYTWTPAWGEEGRYVIQAWARNAGSTGVYDAWAGTDTFEIQRAPIHLSTTTAFPVPPGTQVRWTASVSNPSATIEYQYFVYDRSTGTWANARGYSTDSSFTWTPATSGTYALQVWARRVGSTAPYEQWRGTENLNVSVTPASVSSLTANVALPATPGTSITWTAVGRGGSRAPLQYRFYLYTEGSGWRLLRDYSSVNTVTWTPGTSDIGAHLVQVWVRSNGSTATYEGWLGSPYFLIRP